MLMTEEAVYAQKTRNAYALEAEFDWLETVIQTRMKLHFGQECDYASVFDIQAPEQAPEHSLYGHFIHHYNMELPERIAFLTVLAPNLKPNLLDVFFKPNGKLSRGYSEFGGVKGQFHSGFLPTAETVLFILAGDHIASRMAFDYLFDNDHYFTQHRIFLRELPTAGEPPLSCPLSVSAEIIDLVTRGKIKKPAFSSEFPARVLTTQLEWEDLVLSNQTREQLNELQAWIQFEEQLMKGWEMSAKLKPGYRCLFYGPPGTGKTLTAALLGKRYERDVFRVDLSTVVSKYIGETEKNLERIFEQTVMYNSILFFDEADALFGKRTNVNEAHDRYANQEVSYLLQRIEDYEGVVILASNFKTNIDDAFMRRFQSAVFFPMPEANERYRLWNQAFSPKSQFENTVNLEEIAKKYVLAGGSIVNVARYASLMTIQRNAAVILLSDILAGIRREFQKEGKNI